MKTPIKTSAVLLGVPLLFLGGCFILFAHFPRHIGPDEARALFFSSSSQLPVTNISIKGNSDRFFATISMVGDAISTECIRCGYKPETDAELAKIEMEMFLTASRYYATLSPQDLDGMVLYGRRDGVQNQQRIIVGTHVSYGLYENLETR